jgi:hypothetical protein
MDRLKAGPPDNRAAKTVPAPSGSRASGTAAGPGRRCTAACPRTPRPGPRSSPARPWLNWPFAPAGIWHELGDAEGYHAAREAVQAQLPHGFGWPGAILAWSASHQVLSSAAWRVTVAQPH